MAFRLLAPLASLAPIAIAIAGCAAEAEPTEATGERVGESASAIINGTASPRSRDQVVQLAVIDGNAPLLCSGTLVASNLVLTARHCVGALDEAEQTVVNYADPSRIHVYVGRDAPKKIRSEAAPAAKGKQIFSEKGTALFPDVALLLLDRDVDAPVASIRLEGGVDVGESITIVGYGLTEKGSESSMRLEREGKKVLKVAPAKDLTGRPLHDGEFTLGEAACSGDSGGPAISDDSGAVLGVASRVGNGKNPTAADPALFCKGDATVNIYTSLAPVKALVTKAFEAAKAEPEIEQAGMATTRSRSPGSSEAAGDAGYPVTMNSGCHAAPLGERRGDVALATIAAAGLVAARRRRRPLDGR